jgi:uncharacterized DUF497 family protein
MLWLRTGYRLRQQQHRQGGQMMTGTFEWDGWNEAANVRQHGVAFDDAQWAFFDTRRVLVADGAHTDQEPRCFCLGRVGGLVLTVRFHYLEGRITLLSAGYWKKGRHFYEAQNGLVR